MIVKMSPIALTDELLSWFVMSIGGMPFPNPIPRAIPATVTAVPRDISFFLHQILAT